MNSSLQIQDRLSLTITINGKEMLFDRVNTLDFLQVSSSVLISIPMLHIRYIDTVDWLMKNKMLFDNAPITLSMTRPGSKLKTNSKFRINSFKETVAEGATIYDIDAYLDVPTYWNSSASEIFNGSASAALEEICTLCGIEKKTIEATTDSQLWVPRNMRYHQWARYISDRGFVSEQSCMKLGFDLLNGMVYKDVLKENPIKAEFGMATFQQNVILVTSYKPRTASGVNNNMLGYNTSMVEQLPLETTQNRTHEKVDVTVGSGKQLVMNNKVKTNAATGRVTHGYIDPGNSNENYERGMYQNKRGAALFSVGVDILTPIVTNVGLLDDVTFFIPKEQGYVKPYSSRYKVMSKAIVISGIDYYEKFQLCSTSINDTYRDGVSSSAKGPLTS